MSWITLTISIIIMQKATMYLIKKGVYTRDKSIEFQKQWFHHAKHHAELNAFIMSEEYDRYLIAAIKDTFIMFLLSMAFLWAMSYYPILLTYNNTNIYWYYPLLILFAYKIILWIKVTIHAKKVRKNQEKTSS